MKNEHLAIQYINLAYSRAHKFDKGVFDIEELKSVSMLGLVKAANTYNPDKNVKFLTYATRVIDNEIKLYLRKNKKNIGIMSLEYEYEDDLFLKDKLTDTENDFEIKVEEKDLCLNAFEKIKDYSIKEQKIFHLYIYNGYTTRLISELTGVSQSYVSRVLKQIFEKLRKDLDVNSKQKHLTRNKINSII